MSLTHELGCTLAPLFDHGGRALPGLKEELGIFGEVGFRSFFPVSFFQVRIYALHEISNRSCSGPQF